MMRVFGRHDGVLLAGLLFALLVIFQPPIHAALALAREIEATYGVELLPALVILGLLFTSHQYVKRGEAKAQAATMAAEAAQIRERIEELEQLGTLGRALARTVNLDALREVLWRHLPTLSEERDVWVLIRPNGHWEVVVDTAGGGAGDRTSVLERLAEKAVAPAAGTLLPPDSLRQDGHLCFPMAVGGKTTGVFGILDGPTPCRESRQRTLAAAAALVAIAVRNTQLFTEIRDNSIHDSLTGCFTRAYALELIDLELKRSRRSGAHLSIVMLDIDGFKGINDRYGHLIGDSALAAVGCRLKDILRTSDIHCRYGGDEFLVVLPDTPLSGALHVAEWLREEIGKITLASRGEMIRLSASLGVAAAPKGQSDPGKLIGRADQAMYRAKLDGRDCVRAAPDLPTDEACAKELALCVA